MTLLFFFYDFYILLSKIFSSTEPTKLLDKNDF